MIKPKDILAHDVWAMADGSLDTGPFILRWRTPVFNGADSGQYIYRVSVLWAYAEENSGDLPDDQLSEAMAVFEDRLCHAWEYDGNAILAAVLTFDGARQWLFYTRNVDECGERIAGMPQEEEAYPIEINTEEDPGWTYLREQMLASVDWEQHQSEWEDELKAQKKASNKLSEQRKGRKRT